MVHGTAGIGGDASDRSDAAQAPGNGRRASGTGAARAVAGPRRSITPAAASRSSTRARAARAGGRDPVGRRASGACGRATSSAASAGVSCARLLAEIGQRRRPDAFDIAAERGQLQVKRQDVALSQPPFQRQRDADLAQLARPAPGRPILQQARNLHGQRRAARDDPTVAQRLSRGARQRLGSTPAWSAEALVLIGDQHRQIARVHRDRASTASASARRRRYRPAAAPRRGQHLDRGGARQRRQVGRIDPPVEAIAPQRRQKQPNCKT
jgi:hypothetical protein